MNAPVCSSLCRCAHCGAALAQPRVYPQSWPGTLWRAGARVARYLGLLFGMFILSLLWPVIA